jgi:hypothetical protein
VRKVYDRLYVGTYSDCNINKDNWVTIHACKHDCHKNAVGYKTNIDKSHPNYLFLETDYNLYLNMIDPVKPLFYPETFNVFLDFAEEKYLEGYNLLIHCNLGMSRSPSLAMLLLSKRLNVISSESYDSAKGNYISMDKGYFPSSGIDLFLYKNWDKVF